MLLKSISHTKTIILGRWFQSLVLSIILKFCFSLFSITFTQKEALCHCVDLKAIFILTIAVSMRYHTRLKKIFWFSFDSNVLGGGGETTIVFLYFSLQVTHIKIQVAYSFGIIKLIKYKLLYCLSDAYIKAYTCKHVSFYFFPHNNPAR